MSVKVEEIFSKEEVESFLKDTLGVAYNRLEEYGVPFTHKLMIYVQLRFPGIPSFLVTSALSSGIEKASVKEIGGKNYDNPRLFVVDGFLTLQKTSDWPVAFLCPVHRVQVRKNWVCPICGKKVRAVRIWEFNGFLSAEGVSVPVVYYGEDNLAPVGVFATLLVLAVKDQFVVLKALKVEPLVFTPSGTEEKEDEEEVKASVGGSVIALLPWAKKEGKEEGKVEVVEVSGEKGVDALRKFLEGAKIRGEVLSVDDLVQQFGVSEDVVEGVVSELGGRVDDDGNVVW